MGEKTEIMSNFPKNWHNAGLRQRAMTEQSVYFKPTRISRIRVKKDLDPMITRRYQPGGKSSLDVNESTPDIPSKEAVK